MLAWNYVIIIFTVILNQVNGLSKPLYRFYMLYPY